MTAVPRDPSFWKRFSNAAHLDAAQNPSKYDLGKYDLGIVTVTPVSTSSTGSSSSASTRPSIKHQDSWLEAQVRKNRRNKVLLWVYGLSVVAVISIIVIVLVWLFRHGLFLHGEPLTFP